MYSSPLRAEDCYRKNELPEKAARFIKSHRRCNHLYAPNGTVKLTGNNVHVSGYIIAKNVIIESEEYLNIDPAAPEEPDKKEYRLS